MCATLTADRTMRNTRNPDQNIAHDKLLLLTAVIQVVEELADAWADDHAEACDCGFCRHRPAMRRDVAGIAWSAEAAGIIESELVWRGVDLSDGDDFATFGEWLRALADFSDLLDAREPGDADPPILLELAR